MQNPLLSIIVRILLSTGLSCALQPQAAAFTTALKEPKAFEVRGDDRDAPTLLNVAASPAVLRTRSPRPE